MFCLLHHELLAAPMYTRDHERLLLGYGLTRYIQRKQNRSFNVLTISSVIHNIKLGL